MVNPKAKMPTVELPAAEPQLDATVAAVADPLTQPEYVYFSRLDKLLPMAKIPNVEFPAADPPHICAVDAVAVAFVSPE